MLRRNVKLDGARLPNEYEISDHVPDKELLTAAHVKSEVCLSIFRIDSDPRIGLAVPG